MTTAHIRISQEDDDRLMNECKATFLKSHPEMKGMHLSRAFIVHKLIEYYL